jgi:hypothetical protein
MSAEPKVAETPEDERSTPRLALAPDAIRCEKLLPAPNGGSPTRCSRFSIKLPNGERDIHCVSHSRAKHAHALRSKAATAQAAAFKADRAERLRYAEGVVPCVWQQRSDFQASRRALARLVMAGLVTVTQSREVRAILAEAQHEVKAFDWPEECL